MKLPWCASKTGSITRLPKLEVHGAMQVLQPVRLWEVGQGRRHSAFNEVFWPEFCCSFSTYHSNFVARWGSCQSLPSHVPLALTVPRLVFRSSACAAFCPGIAEFLHVHLSNGSVLPDGFIVWVVGPVLPDGFIERVVLREARSPCSLGADGFSHA